jgi:hypothetical protein
VFNKNTWYEGEVLKNVYEMVRDSDWCMERKYGWLEERRKEIHVIQIVSPCPILYKSQLGAAW